MNYHRSLAFAAVMFAAQGPIMPEQASAAQVAAFMKQHLNVQVAARAGSTVHRIDACKRRRFYNPHVFLDGGRYRHVSRSDRVPLSMAGRDAGRIREIDQCRARWSARQEQVFAVTHYSDDNSIWNTSCVTIPKRVDTHAVDGEYANFCRLPAE